MKKMDWLYPKEASCLFGDALRGNTMLQSRHEPSYYESGSLVNFQVADTGGPEHVLAFVAEACAAGTSHQPTRASLGWSGASHLPPHEPKITQTRLSHPVDRALTRSSRYLLVMYTGQSAGTLATNDLYVHSRPGSTWRMS